MTASKDSTLKVWMIGRAGITQKYIPDFDKAELELVHVIPDKERALTAGTSVRYLEFALYQSSSLVSW